MNVGDEITITPTELVAGGEAIARVDGFPIFATNVYPGDVAVVRLLEVKKGFAHADLVRVVEPSPLRRAPLRGGSRKTKSARGIRFTHHSTGAFTSDTFAGTLRFAQSCAAAEPSTAVTCSNTSANGRLKNPTPE